MQNENVSNEVIGIGSLNGWTRGQVIEEYNSIKSHAEKGNLTLEEWDSMTDTLAKLYLCTNCERFSTLVRLFLFGKFEDLKFEDCVKNLC